MITLITRKLQLTPNFIVISTFCRKNCSITPARCKSNKISQRFAKKSFTNSPSNEHTSGLKFMKPWLHRSQENTIDLNISSLISALKTSRSIDTDESMPEKSPHAQSDRSISNKWEKPSHQQNLSETLMKFFIALKDHVNENSQVYFDASGNLKKDESLGSLLNHFDSDIDIDIESFTPNESLIDEHDCDSIYKSKNHLLNRFIKFLNEEKPVTHTLNFLHDHSQKATPLFHQTMDRIIRSVNLTPQVYYDRSIKDFVPSNWGLIERRKYLVMSMLLEAITEMVESRSSTHKNTKTNNFGILDSGNPEESKATWPNYDKESVNLLAECVPVIHPWESISFGYEYSIKPDTPNIELKRIDSSTRGPINDEVWFNLSRNSDSTDGTQCLASLVSRINSPLVDYTIAPSFDLVKHKNMAPDQVHNPICRSTCMVQLSASPSGFAAEWEKLSKVVKLGALVWENGQNKIPWSINGINCIVTDGLKWEIGRFEWDSVESFQKYSKKLNIDSTQEHNRWVSCNLFGNSEFKPSLEYHQNEEGILGSNLRLLKIAQPLDIGKMDGDLLVGLIKWWIRGFIPPGGFETI